MEATLSRASRLLLFVFAWILCGAASNAFGQTDLRQRLRNLSAPVSAGAKEQALRALDICERHDGPASDRACRIAEVATLLAEELAAREQSAAALLRAQRLRREVGQRYELAWQALQLAQQQRNSQSASVASDNASPADEESSP